MKGEVRVLPLYSYNIFIHKKYCKDEPDLRPHSKQGCKTGGPKYILKSTKFKRSSKTTQVSKIPLYASAFCIILSTIQFNQYLRNDQWWSTLRIIAKRVQRYQCHSQLHLQRGCLMLVEQGAAEPLRDQLREKANMGESKQKARVSFFVCVCFFYQIDSGILEAAEQNHPLDYRHSVTSTFFFGKLEICLTPTELLIFTP